MQKFDASEKKKKTTRFKEANIQEYELTQSEMRMKRTRGKG